MRKTRISLTTTEEQIVMEEDWKNPVIRNQSVQKLKKVLDEFEGIGYLAEDIEKSCFESATSEKEYVEKLAKILLDRSNLDCNSFDCDICIFLRKVTAKDWTPLNQIEI